MPIKKKPCKAREKHGGHPNWKKGISGNPKGRPKEADRLTSLSFLLKAEIEKICPNDKQGRTWKELIVIATMQQAIKGNPAAMREVWDRMDGKVTQPLSSDPENPIGLIINGVDLTNFPGMEKTGKKGKREK